jgi:hypothetical protein
MARPAGPRLSLEPLLGMLAANGIEPEFLPKKTDNAIRNAKFRGYFTLSVADEIACHVLKMHPLEVWGEEYEREVWFDSNEEVAA